MSSGYISSIKILIEQGKLSPLNPVLNILTEEEKDKLLGFYSWQRKHLWLICSLFGIGAFLVGAAFLLDDLLNKPESNYLIASLGSLIAVIGIAFILLSLITVLRQSTSRQKPIPEHFLSTYDQLCQLFSMNPETVNQTAIGDDGTPSLKEVAERVMIGHCRNVLEARDSLERTILDEAEILGDGHVTLERTVTIIQEAIVAHKTAISSKNRALKILQGTDLLEKNEGYYFRRAEESMSR